MTYSWNCYINSALPKIFCQKYFPNMLDRHCWNLQYFHSVLLYNNQVCQSQILRSSIIYFMYIFICICWIRVHLHFVTSFETLWCFPCNCLNCLWHFTSNSKYTGLNWSFMSLSIILLNLAAIAVLSFIPTQHPSAAVFFDNLSMDGPTHKRS